VIGHVNRSSCCGGAQEVLLAVVNSGESSRPIAASSASPAAIYATQPSDRHLAHEASARLTSSSHKRMMIAQLVTHVKLLSDTVEITIDRRGVLERLGRGEQDHIPPSLDTHCVHQPRLARARDHRGHHDGPSAGHACPSSAFDFAVQSGIRGPETGPGIGPYGARQICLKSAHTAFHHSKGRGTGPLSGREFLK
jgi:hypothetical protein